MKPPVTMQPAVLEAADAKPPIAKRIPVERSAHGVHWVDDYAWLRAENWQDCIEDPSLLPEQIKAYLEAENAWFESSMADTQTLQSTLQAEMRGRIQADDDSLPDTEGAWCYLERYQGEEEHPSYWRYPKSQESLEPENRDEQLLIDFNIVAGHHDYFEPGDVEYSPDHQHLAWSSDSSGSERYSVVVRDLSIGEGVDDVAGAAGAQGAQSYGYKDTDSIEDVESVVWGDARHLFYTRVDEDHRPSRVFRHELGTDAADDVLVFEEKDPRFFCSVWISLSKKYLFISSDMDDQSEVWFIDTDDICASPQLFQKRTDGLEYSVEHQNNRFLILTNADGANDFKIMQVACSTPARTNWTDWLPYRSGRMVLELFAYKNWVMWLERENALPRICFARVDFHDGASADADVYVDADVDVDKVDHAADRPGEIHRIDFSEEAYALSLEPLLEFDEERFRFSYESPSTPSQTWLYDMTTHERCLLKEDLIPSGHCADDYVVRRRYAESADGESVPVTLLYHRNTVLDGTAPCWLTGYGAYGSSMPADFSTTRLSLIDRGFVYVIAHVRGGQEKGRAWYDAARFGGKPKSVDDLVAVGEYLVEQKYSAAGRIILSGGSAGGLLVAATLNRSCNLWGGAIADVPFVDALNTMLDDSLPLTPAEWSQWGNPIINEQAFHDIRAYSPYDNVEARAYPPMLVTAGVSDPRVTYWEPAKWVARHRNLRSDDTLLVLKTNMHSGHFGETGRYASLADYAIEQAFALKILGCC